MFCKNCGNQIEEGLRFCGQCGTPVVQEDVFSTGPVAENDTATSEPVLNNETVQEQPVENSGFNVVIPEGEAEVVDNSFLTQPQDPPKRKKKFVKVLAVILAILVVLGTCFLIFKDDLMNFWRWTTMSNDQKLQYAFSKQTTSAIGNVADAYSDIINAVDDSLSIEGSISAEAPQELISTIVGQDISLNKISAKYSFDYVPGKAAFKLSYTADDKELISAEYYLDIENQTIAFYVPQLNDKAVQIDISTFANEINMMSYDFDMINQLLSSDALTDIIPVEEIISDILPDLVDAALEQLIGVTEEDCDFTAGNVTESLTKLSVGISEDTVHRMFVAVVEEVRDNARIKDIIYSLPDKLESVYSMFTGSNAMMGIGFAMPSGDTIYQLYTSTINEFLEEIKDVNTSKDVVATLSTYVNYNFDIIAMEFEVPEEGILISYGATTDGNNWGLEFKEVVNETVVLSVVGNGTKSGDEYTGKISLNVYDNEELSEIIVINCKDFDVDSCSEGIYRGEVEIKLGDKLLKTFKEQNKDFGPLSNIISAGDPSIVLKFNDSDDVADRTIVLKFGEAELLTVNTTLKTSDSASVNIPSNVTEDYEQWFSDAYDSLKELFGVDPSTLIGQADQVASNPYLDESYNYYY